MGRSWVVSRALVWGGVFVLPDPFSIAGKRSWQSVPGGSAQRSRVRLAGCSSVGGGRTLCHTPRVSGLTHDFPASYVPSARRGKAALHPVPRSPTAGPERAASAPDFPATTWLPGCCSRGCSDPAAGTPTSCCLFGLLGGKVSALPLPLP